MAVDHVWLETDHRQGRQSRLAEERKFLQIIKPIPIRLIPVEIGLIVNKIESNAVQDILQNTHVTVLPQVPHIEMVNIGHLIAPGFLDA